MLAQIHYVLVHPDYQWQGIAGKMIEYIKEKYNKPRNVYLGLVHRLDRPVGGVMIFAKTSKSASRLSNQVREKVFKKKYLAVVDGKIENKKRYFRRLFI